MDFERRWKRRCWKPDGGYRPIEAGVLWAAWIAYLGRITAFDLRVYWACHLLAWTRLGGPGRYSEAELLRWLGGSGHRRERQLREALRHLRDAGLVIWSETEIRFGPPGDCPVGFDRWPERRVPVPRRTLELLARTSGKAKVATILGHLVRCMRLDASDPERPVICSGVVKASWIAETFGISIRGAKAARAQLVAAGELVVIETPVIVRNKHGARCEIAGVVERKPATISAPPARLGATVSAPLLRKQNPLRESETQNPAPRPGAGASQPRLSEMFATDSAMKLSEMVALYRRNPTPIAPESPKVGAMNPRPTSGQRRMQGDSQATRKAPPWRASGPRIDDMTEADLRDPVRLAVLFDQAVARSWIEDTEAELLAFRAAAEHALRRGRDPVKLFRWTIERGRWDVISGADEDAARGRSRRGSRAAAAA